MARQPSVQPVDGQAACGHPQRHSRIIAALEFHVDQTAVNRLAQNVQSQVPRPLAVPRSATPLTAVPVSSRIVSVAGARGSSFNTASYPCM